MLMSTTRCLFRFWIIPFLPGPFPGSFPRNKSEVYEPLEGQDGLPFVVHSIQLVLSPLSGYTGTFLPF